MNLISYNRVSTGDQHTSLLRYEESTRQFCVRHNHNLVGVFSDEDVSGSTRFRDRPQGRIAFEMLITKQADGIIADDTTRMFRDLEDGIFTMNRIEEAGALLFYGDGYGEPVSIATPNGFRNAIYPLVDAHLERLKIKDRIIKSMVYKRSNGLATSLPPFGFKRSEDKEDKKLYPIEEEMRVVDIIFAMYGRFGNYSQVAEYLNENNLSSKHGGIWYGKTVKGVIEYHIPLRTYKKEHYELVSPSNLALVRQAM